MQMPRPSPEHPLLWGLATPGPLETPERLFLEIQKTAEKHSPTLLFCTQAPRPSLVTGRDGELESEGGACKVGPRSADSCAPRCSSQGAGWRVPRCPWPPATAQPLGPAAPRLLAPQPLSLPPNRKCPPPLP